MPRPQFTVELVESRILLASIGDSVFHDLNADGIRDSGEPGLASVEVRLYLDTNADGRLDERDAYKQSATTDSQGQYTFSGLAAGDYLVRVADNSLTPGFVSQSDQAQAGLDDGLRQTLHRIMSNHKNYLINQIAITFDPDLEISDPNILYDIQFYTNNALRYAGETRDIEMLSDLSDIYLRAHDELLLREDYAYYNWSGENALSVHDLETSAYMWVGNPAGQDEEFPIESLIASSQFTFAVANLINYILDVPSGQRTQSMNDLVSDYDAILLNDHFERWIFAGQGIFQTKGWGGPAGLYNHSEHLQNLINHSYGSSVSYINAVTDTDMWIVAGVVEMLAANAKDPTAVPIGSTLKQNLQAYVKLASRLFESRLTESDLTNFDGHPVKGVNFDLGVWKDHPDHAYVGYTGGSSPLGQSAMPQSSVGWDVSHATRFVNFFETLYRNRSLTGQTWVDDELMSRIANQLVYGAFNKDLDEPLLNNFMDGTNGWYRVGYTSGFGGYSPNELTQALIFGGYGFWGRFHPDVARVVEELWSDIDSVMMLDDSGNAGDVMTSADWAEHSTYNGTLSGHITVDSSSFFNAGTAQAYASDKGTIELWFKTDRASTSEDLVNIFETQYQDFLLVRRNANNTINLLLENNDTETLSITTSATITVGEWNHLIITQDGSGAKIYLNGSLSSVTGTNSAYWTDHLAIAGAWFGKSQWDKFQGGLDGIRIQDGPISASEALRRYQKDNVAAYWTFDNADEGSLVWSASLTASGKNAGGALFDGTDDYFRAHPDAAFDTANGTIEFWFKPTASSNVDDLYYVSENNYNDYLLVRRGSDDKINVIVEDNNTNLVDLTSSSTITVGSWNHVAVTQDGGGVKIFINGTQSSVTGTNSSSTWTSHLNISSVWAGGTTSWGNYFGGTMDDLRVLNRALTATEVKARYSGEGTLFSWDFENRGEKTVVWNAAFSAGGQIGDAVLFDGTDDYVRIEPGSSYATNQGTIEFWYKPTASSNIDDLYYISENNYNDYLLIRRNANNTIGVIIEDNNSTLVDIASAATINVGEWNHLAISQDGSSVKIHINGAQSSTTGTNSASAWTSHLNISSIWAGGTTSWGYYLGGSMDELRMYDRALASVELDQHYSREQREGDWQFNREPDAGTVAYLSQYYGDAFNKVDSLELLQLLPVFTAMQPTKAVAVSSAQTVTNADLALMHHNGTEPLAAPDEFVVKNAAWTSQGIAGGAMVFDGVDDYIRVSPSQALATSQGTIEFWFKPTASSNVDDLLYVSENTYNDYLLISRNSNNTINVLIEDNNSTLVNATSSATITENEWNHLAISQDGDGVKIYINGVQSSTSGTNSSSTWTGHLNITSIWAGGTTSWGNYLAGSMDEIHVYNQAMTGQAIAQHRNGAARSQPGMTGSWRFDVQADSAGTFSGTTLTRAGRTGAARLFDGVDDSLNGGADTSFKSSTGAIEFWYKPSDASRQEDIVNVYETSTNDYLLVRRDSDDRLRILIKDNGSSLVDLFSVATIASQEWNHIIVTQAGSGIKIYLNGIESSVTGTNSNSTWTNHLTVNGAYFGRSNLSSFMKGQLDDIRVYNSGLTSAQAKQRYYGISHAVSSPVKRWGFDVLADAYSSNSTTWLPTGAQFGSASFDGTDDYFDGGALTGLNTSQGAIDLWIKPTATNRTEELVKIYETSTNDYLLVRRESDNRVRVIIRDDGTNRVDVVTTSTLTNGQWNHLAVVQDGSGVKLYINGAVATTTGTNSNSAWMSHLAIAGTYFGKAHSGNTFTGAMDRIQLFSRALTSNEIIQHAAGTYNSRDELRWYWDFDYQPGTY